MHFPEKGHALSILLLAHAEPIYSGYMRFSTATKTTAGDFHKIEIARF
jgi:hypothetical protein